LSRPVLTVAVVTWRNSCIWDSEVSCHLCANLIQ